MTMSQGPAERRVTPMKDHIDAYKCPACGTSFFVNADEQTFSAPPPMECDSCGAWDMVARRYVAKDA